MHIYPQVPLSVSLKRATYIQKPNLHAASLVGGRIPFLHPLYPHPAQQKAEGLDEAELSFCLNLSAREICCHLSSPPKCSLKRWVTDTAGDIQQKPGVERPTHDQLDPEPSQLLAATGPN
ncbi:Hypothetical predicted protein [Podarcis lilfordi]|uniref:Uncharacterized protein n=1 Tax=Podarcis lilfordi TaxID=74358 RepID=A0AA35KFC7_9SAUR|nr:Hypothetical predicted protein [Podarcis lilfordi]